ncbi:MAG: DUF58 domain-containing protein [Thermoplasmataceae archaeon]|jgi:uncharacterized protein (DUF58 family)|nr:DUF58 domain-containing protein [Candidatus Thermoplasmatota archaeon]
MIRKSGYLLLAILSYGIFESLLLGYPYYIALSVILFFVVSSDILLFNRGPALDLYNVDTKRIMPGKSSRKFQSVNIEIVFSNRGKKRVYFHYFDTLSDVFKSSGQYEGFLSLEPGEEVTKEYSIESIAIGKYKIGPVKIYTQDPMKLCLVEYTIPSVDEVSVSPAIADIHTHRSERLSNFVFYMGVHYSRKVGQGYDFYGVRQYTESDDFRYVAWNRYGAINGEDLYIKQMEEEKPIDVIFAMDYSWNVNQGTAEKRMYDSIVNVVINAAYAILKNHDGVGFMIDSSAHDHFITPTKSEESVKNLEKLVSEIRPDGTFNILSVMEKVKKRIKKNALIFLISPFSYPESFSRGNPNDYKIGKRVFVFLVDPDSFVEKRDDPVYEKLLFSAGIVERGYLSNVAKFFQSMGIKSSVAKENDLLMRLMSEYRYGKMTNEGY